MLPLDILEAYVRRIPVATEVFLFEIMLPRRDYELDREDALERDGYEAFDTYLDNYCSLVNFYLYWIGIFFYNFIFIVLF